MPDFLSILSLTWLSGLLLIVGIVLVVIEMFLPGVGVPGISGVICIIVGFILAVNKMNNLMGGIVLFLIVVAILGIALTVAMRMYSKGSLNRTQLVLGSELSAEAGFNSLDEAGVEPGTRGIVTTTLRPVGVVEIGGVKREAQSEAVFIEKGEEVIVISTEGRRIIVAPLKEV